MDRLFQRWFAIFLCVALVLPLVLSGCEDVTDIVTTENMTEDPTEDAAESVSEDCTEESKGSDDEANLKPIDSSEEEEMPSPPILATEVVVDKTTIRLNVGDESTLSATVLPISTTDRQLIWTSSDPSVVVVCEGRITAIGVGTATITAETGNGKNAICEVTVVLNRISFKSLGVDGTDVYGKVSNAVETYSFDEEIGVSGDATYQVFEDIECIHPLQDKTVSLCVGDNTFYVMEHISDSVENLYTVTIRRRAVCLVTFDPKGGSVVKPQTVEEDGFATVPDTERKGYTFAGWSHDLSLPITEDVVISASWTNNSYTVTYNANGGTTENASITVMYGLSYALEVPERTGYVFMGWHVDGAKVSKSGVWTMDKNVTLRAKWKKGTYTVTYDPNGGEVERSSTTVTFETFYTLEEPVRVEYTFAGWYYGETKISLSGNWKIGEDVTLKAEWTPLENFS